jgi:branched-subunit amino acid transport protein
MTANTTDASTLLTIAGLAVVTVIARSFFFISSKAWTLPAWVEKALQYAPIAALSAVIVPEIVVLQGVLTPTWQDARIFGAAAGAACFFATRSTLWCIAAGMAVYLPLHIGLGW